MEVAYETEDLSSWKSVTEAIDSFPRPNLHMDPEGGWSQDLWVFRGHKNDGYHLEPSVERAANSLIPWATFEEKMLYEEFQPKARMHMDPGSLPAAGDKLSWLALMQHYGIPTRLLDFTLSPYVALYFAIRGRTPNDQSASYVAVWAIDAKALMTVCAETSKEAYKKEVELEVREPVRNRRVGVSLMPSFAVSDTDIYRIDSEGEKEIVSAALKPHRVRRNYFDQKGFVAFALPPVQNRRLSNQQGAFLFNGAEDLTFEESLFKMMDRYQTKWYRRFRIPSGLVVEIEQRLFQMNVHELSLFPDMEGLAGYISQKARLFWTGKDRSNEALA